MRTTMRTIMIGLVLAATMGEYKFEDVPAGDWNK